MHRFDNPWGDNSSRPSNNAGNQDSIEQIFRKLQAKFLEAFGVGGTNGRNGKGFSPVTAILAAVLVFLIMWGASGIFTVDTNEVGVVLRFGEFNRVAAPGMNYKLPYPLESVDKVNVTRIRRENIGFDPSKANSSLTKSEISIPQESLMLTGDENIIDLHFFVQWYIKDAHKFIFNLKNNTGDNTVRAAAESALRQVIGTVKLSEALSEQRLEIENKAQKILQETLQSYASGIEIANLGILYSYVAPEVRDAYRDIQSAKADQEKVINQAYAYRNDLLPRAHGEAESIIQNALAYKESTIIGAHGESTKFQKVLKAYSKEKEVTRKRMYLQTMEDVLKDVDKMILDSKANSVLPYLPLNEILNKK